MRKLIIAALWVLLVLIFAGCASLEYKEGGSGPEMHPGHVGHEIHSY